LKREGTMDLDEAAKKATNLRDSISALADTVAEIVDKSYPFNREATERIKSAAEHLESATKSLMAASTHLADAQASLDAQRKGEAQLKRPNP
jgi:hypothetical protein